MSAMNHFDRLPDAVLSIIFSMMSTDYLIGACKLVSKRWNQVSDQATTLNMYRVSDSTLRRFISTRHVPLRDVRLYKSGGISSNSVELMAPNLRFLHCGYFFQGLPCFPSASKFSMLEILSLQCWSFTECPMASFPLLRIMSLKEVTISDSVLRDLINACPRIQSLGLIECDWLCTPVIESSTMEQLEVSSLCGTLKVKVVTPKLRRLQIGLVHTLDVYAVSRLDAFILSGPVEFVFHDGLQFVKRMVLFDNDWTVDTVVDTLRCLRGSVRVYELQLLFYSIEDDPFEVGPLLNCLKNVETLSLESALLERIGIAEVPTLADRAPDLKTVKVFSPRDMHSVGFRGLRSLVKRCPGLKNVHLTFPKWQLKNMHQKLRGRLEQLQCAVVGAQIDCSELKFEGDDMAIDWASIFASPRLY